MKLSTRSIARVLTILVSVVLPCLAAELVLRILAPPPDTPGLFAITGDELEYVGRPYARGRVSGAPVSFNGVGMRDRDYSRTPADGDRILMLGDSFTFGVGVAEEQTYPRLTEALLNKSRGPRGRPVEVLNFGIPGYNTLHEVELLRRFGLALHPDIVVVGFLYNDADLSPAQHLRLALESEGRPTRAGASDNAANANERAAHAPSDSTPKRSLKALAVSHVNEWLNAMKGRSKFFSWLSPRIAVVLRRWGVKSLGQVAEYDTHFADSREDWRVTRAALLEIKRLCDKDRIRVIVAIIPALTNFTESTYPLMTYHKAVSDFCRSANITYVDLLPAFWGRDGTRFWLTPIDAHPDAQGYSIIADALARFLEPRLDDVPRFRAATTHE